MLTATAEHHPAPAPAGLVVSSGERGRVRRAVPEGARLVWLRAHPATSPHPRSAAKPHFSAISPRPRTPAHPRSAATSGPAAGGAVFVTSGRRSPPHRTRSVARAAGDPVVTIVDFHFTPATTTVHVGDTVTWTNDGSMPHSATARDGSFDTGIITKGQSASHTFTQPGTFSYFCKVHPFMHGTVVVLSGGSPVAGQPSAPPAASAPAPAGPSATPSPPAPAAAPADSTGSRAAAPTLPVTGLNLIGALSAGLLLLGCGITLRRLGAERSACAREGGDPL